MERQGKNKREVKSRLVETRERSESVILHVFFFHHHLILYLEQPFAFANPLRPRVPDDVTIRPCALTGSKGEGRDDRGACLRFFTHFLCGNLFLYNTLDHPPPNLFPLTPSEASTDCIFFLPRIKKSQLLKMISVLLYYINVSLNDLIVIKMLADKILMY